MKRYYLLLLLLPVLFSACTEDELTPTVMTSIIDRFEFPQGDSPADVIFKRIYDEYGIKVIYTGFDATDLNRSWQAINTGGLDASYLWNYVTDENELLEAATTLEEKVFGILPKELVKKAARSCPYIYLLDELHPSTSEAREPLYPVEPLDGIGVNLELGAADNNYVYKVYFPLRIVTKFFITLYLAGEITLPPAFFSELGTMDPGYYVKYNTAAADPQRYDNYWARQGRLPEVGVYTGHIYLGKNTAWQSISTIPPLTRNDREVPYFFMYLCVDKNWRSYFDTAGKIFYDCPRLQRRLELFHDHMKNYGIDFEEIQDKMYAGTTIDTAPYPERFYDRNVTPVEERYQHIYYEFNNN